MRDLWTVAKECMDELSRIGVPYGNVVRWDVNTRAKNRWGQCIKSESGTAYSINISSKLLDDNSDIVGLKNTIIHELLHTIKGAHGHTGEWLKWANYVNYKLGYNIKRCSSAEEKGIAEDIIKKSLNDYKYIVECPHCHTQWKKMRKTNLIQYPSLYSCGRCKEKLVRIQ